ncbi:MAG: hypothetical protein K8S98_06725 [Planctomycetes bacterium]|nr:hypothetical protein [Planctomycetota bacterium]
MLILRPVKLHWIRGDADDPADVCAHSPVEFSVDGHCLVAPEQGDWTVSASALYLLRSLSGPHTRDRRVGDHLFPCCGFCMYEVPESDDVLVFGCSNGINVWVERVGEEVRLGGPDGTTHDVTFDQWRHAVCAFSDEVRAFFRRGSPKTPHDDDVLGFRRFLAEWDRRRANAERPS